MHRVTRNQLSSQLMVKLTTLLTKAKDMGVTATANHLHGQMKLH